MLRKFLGTAARKFTQGRSKSTSLITDLEDGTHSIVVFDNLHRLRVYSRYGTLLALNNVEILLDQQETTGTLHIYVWRSSRGGSNQPDTALEQSEQGKEA